VYHTIKVLSSRGFSTRKIAKDLKLSKTTVFRYLNLKDTEFSQIISLNRKSEFDLYKSYLISELETFPELRTTKLYRKLKEKHPEITGCRRSFHNYISKLEIVNRGSSKRYYEPIETSPGLQVQVDPGEMKVKFLDGGHQKIYFVVFVFSFSRMKYVYFQDRVFNTLDFIKAHKEAFIFYGCKANEYVYDQTKLVVINERYREVWLNEKFHKFALDNSFTPNVCEGYDPESKGKVERVVREVKEDFLYGDKFSSLLDIRNNSLDWLDRVNTEVHSTTGKKPSILFEEEKKLCTVYQAKNSLFHKRLVDKVGLLSFEGNKYSVPEKYQQSYVNIKVSDHLLFIYDIKEDKKITEHPLSTGSGNISKNNNHYRNYDDKLSELKKKVREESKNISSFCKIIDQIEINNPKIIRDQLRGLIKIIRNNSVEELEKYVPILLNMVNLSAYKIEKAIEELKGEYKISNAITHDIYSNEKENKKSKLDRSLNYYMNKETRL